MGKGAIVDGFLPITFFFALLFLLWSSVLLLLPLRCRMTLIVEFQFLEWSRFDHKKSFNWDPAIFWPILVFVLFYEKFGKLKNEIGSL